MARPVKVLGTEAYIKIVINPSGLIEVTSSIDDIECVRHYLNEALKSVPKSKMYSLSNGKIHPTAQ